MAVCGADFGGKKLGVDRVVFRPGGFDGTGEGQDVFVVESGNPSAGVVANHSALSCNGLLRVLADKLTGIGIGGIAADVLQAPVEGLDATVVVGGPAAVLVAADFAFEPVHR